MFLPQRTPEQIDVIDECRVLALGEIRSEKDSIYFLKRSL